MSAPSPSDKQALLSAGVERFQAGDLAAAERSFRQVLDAEPDDPDALHLLGLCRHQAGHSADAVALIAKAVARAPNETYLNNLGQIQAAMGDVAAAAGSYRRAIEAKPRFAEAMNNLGNALAAMGQAEDAIAEYRRATETEPGYALAHYNLGSLLVDKGDTDGAIQCFRRVLALTPDNAEAMNNLGLALEQAGEIEAALEQYQRALERQPAFAKAINNIGNARRKMGAFEAAQASYRAAIEADPAEASAYTNLGYLLTEFGDPEEGISWHRKAIGIDPDHREAHINLAQALLLTGRLAEGWAEYEWRFRVPGSRGRREFAAPLWQGEALDGKTILAWGEQGVGDEVLHAGMVPDLIDAGARVIVECDPRLVPLFGRSFPGVDCVARRSPPAPEISAAGIDVQAPSGSLGRWLRPDLESFPERPSYLAANEARRDALRERYRAGGGDRLVGIAWLSKNVKSGGLKSMALADWRRLVDVPGLRFVDLQYGDTAEERARFETETGVSILHDDAIDQMADLDAFAAQVAAMDLVVSVSNTTVHVAGALGRPTWVMLHTCPMSCWMLDRDRSPWYPSVRLYRQARRGEWEDVLARVAEDLAAWAGD